MSDMRRYISNDRTKGEDGQSLVEIALTLTIAIIILSGILDLGRVYFTYLALQDAAAEGAAYGLIHPTWQYPPGHPLASTLPYTNTNNDPNNIYYRVQNEAPAGVVNLISTTVTTEVLFPTPGNKITVSVSYDYNLITPIVQLFAGGPTMKITGTAVQTIVSPGS